MRKLAFQIAYWATSIFTGLVAIPLLFVPGRKYLMIWLQKYARMMVFWMDKIHNIDVNYRGVENIPDGPCIIASKHQSWGDGYAVFAKINDLAIVTGDHLERLPLVGTILRKMDAVVVDSCGGAHAREKLASEEIARARSKRRKILIYPEGHLAPVGYHYRYRKGVFFMYEAYGCPVVPVATNLGLFWDAEDWNLKPGNAAVEFLEPIEPGLSKDDFMAELEKRIEDASIALLPETFDLPPFRELEYDKATDRGIPIIPENAPEPSKPSAPH